jgi:hypothetical protein
VSGGADQGRVGAPDGGGTSNALSVNATSV